MSHTPNTNRIKPSGLIQATSHKQQASGLDNSHDIGYCRTRVGILASARSTQQGRTRDGTAIDICGGPLMGPRNSAAEILQQRGRYARHEKSPARARNGSCRVMVSLPPAKRYKLQAPSTRPKRQAPSLKL